MSATNITDRDMVTLDKALPSLETLRLGLTAVTDKGMVHISKLAGLRLLELTHTHVTAAALPHLAKLQELRCLILVDTAIDADALRRFRKQHPQCNVVLGRW